jgi:hypothetical protein
METNELQSAGNVAGFAHLTHPNVSTRLTCPPPHSRFSRALGALSINVLLLSVLVVGCVSKSKADAQAHAAFIAGQQQALMRMQQAQNRGPSVTLRGQVHNPVLPWSDGLTLAQAIVNADYYGPEPSEILIVRAGRAIAYDPRNLLSGSDVPLQPGDLVDIRSGPLNSPATMPRN